MREITYTEKLTALEFIKLRDSAGWFPVTEEQAENCIRNCTFLISARSGNEILAMGRAWFDYGYTAYIGDVIVMPAYQRQGIGANIVKNLIQKVLAAAQPGDRIIFFLAAAKNKEGFYEKLGFQRNPNETCGCGMRLNVQK
jgi:GNAT superfamily N-acetyltransferase